MKQTIKAIRYKSFVRYVFIVIVSIAYMTTLTACSAQNSEVNEASEPATNTSVQDVTIETSSEVSTEAQMNSVWTSKVLEGNLALSDVHVFNGGLIGVDGGKIYYSSNGIDWEMTKDMAPYYYYDAFIAGGQFAVYDSNNSHFSSDGKSWTSFPRQDYHLFNTAMYDGNQFIDVDTGSLCLSSDGVKYVKIRADANDPRTEVYFQDDSGYAATISRLANYAGVYYAAGAGVWRSADLYNWTQIVSSGDMTYAAEELLYNGSTFFMPALYENYAFDGTTVTKVEPIGSVFLVDSANHFVGVSGSGASSISSDAITWDPLFSESEPSFIAYCAVIFDNKLFVYGEDGNMRYAAYK